MDYGRILFTCSALCVSQAACEVVVDFDRGKLDGAATQGPTPVPSAEDGAIAIEPDAANLDGALVQPEPGDASLSDAEAGPVDAGTPPAPDAAVSPEMDAALMADAGAADAAGEDAALPDGGGEDAAPPDGGGEDAAPPDARPDAGLAADAGEDGDVADAAEFDAAGADAGALEPGLDGG